MTTAGIKICVRLMRTHFLKTLTEIPHQKRGGGYIINISFSHWTISNKITVQLVSTTTKELRQRLTSLLPSINKISDSIVLQFEGR